MTTFTFSLQEMYVFLRRMLAMVIRRVPASHAMVSQTARASILFFIEFIVKYPDIAFDFDITRRPHSGCAGEPQQIHPEAMKADGNVDSSCEQSELRDINPCSREAKGESLSISGNVPGSERGEDRHLINDHKNVSIDDSYYNEKQGKTF